MGLFSAPKAPPVPPPPPLPPAANPPSIANAGVQAVSARGKAASAAGSNFNGTDLTKPGATGAGDSAKAQLTGQTS